MIRPLLVLALLLAAAPARANLGYFVDLSLKPALVDLRTLYDEEPRPGSCLEGNLREEEGEKALAAVNAVRALHGLAPVKYNGRAEVLASKAALVIAASGKMSHHPGRDLACYSSTALSGSEQSNLYMGTFDGTHVPSTESLVAGWVKDTNVPLLGHRRWILDPTLGGISFGRVDNAAKKVYGAALRIMDPAEKPDLSSPAFVAWPFGKYPGFLWDERAEWSLSMVDLPRDGETQGFDFFSGTTVEIVDETTKRRVDVSRLVRDRQGFGLPNLLSWTVSGAPANRWYSVTARNIRTRDGGTRDLNWRVYIDDEPPTSTVQVAGRHWERKTAAQARDKFTHGEAKRFCSSIGGRVPTRAELTSLVVAGNKLAIDGERFPNISPYANYWTATEWQPGSDLYDVVAFWDRGTVYQQKPAQPGGVLCTFDGPGR